MSELIELRARIAATEADLADAKAAKDRQLVLVYEKKLVAYEQKLVAYEKKLLAYEQKLVELLREKNRLEERAAALAGEYSHPPVLLARGMALLLQALFPERACVYSALHSNSPCTVLPA
jgi:hypothetical protein